MEQISEQVSFAYFDNLYIGQTDQYVEMLDLYCNEYANHRNGLIEAVTNSDIEKFRRIKHKLIYSLHLLSLNQFRDRLEEIAPVLSTTAEDQRHALAHEMSGQFDMLLESILQKRQSLGGENKN